MMQTPGATLGDVRSFDDLRAVLRNRAVALELSRESIDDLVAFPAGYASKLLAPRAIRQFGRQSFEAILKALAVKLVAVEDPAQITPVHVAFKSGKPPKPPSPIITAEVEKLIRDRIRRALAKQGRVGGRKRVAAMTQEARSRSASQAASARWEQLSPERRKFEIDRLNESRRRRQRGVRRQAVSAET